MTDETKVKIATIVSLAVLLVVSIVGITVVAVRTDRDLGGAAVLVLFGTALIAALGGTSWWDLRRHRWKVNVERNGDSKPQEGH